MHSIIKKQEDFTLTWAANPSSQTIHVVGHYRGRLYTENYCITLLALENIITYYELDKMEGKIKTILLVEDEGIIALAGKQTLESRGYRVFLALSGEEAVDMVNSNPSVDLILMDIDLGPGISGTEAAETILEKQDLPVVFLSSHTEPEVVERTEGITSYGYVVKHSGDTVLLASIRMAFKLFEANRSITKKNMQVEAANEELQWWDDIMHYVVEHDPGAVAILDKNLHFMYVSRRFLTDYHVKEQEVTGRYHYDVFPDIPEKWRDVHRRALQGEILRSENDSFIRSDGSIDYTRWECRPWYQENKEVGGIILYTEVITERKKVELALEAEREHLAEILQNIGDAAAAQGWELSPEMLEALGL